MTTDYPVDHEPATPDYVFAVLRESVRLQVGHELTLDESVADLLGAYNDLARPTTPLLADCMNPTFDVNVPLPEWLAAFPTVRRRTVREVCDFLAPRVTRPVIRPWNHVAGSCHPAGAFLTVRGWLLTCGVSENEITPGTPLAPYLLWFEGEFGWPMVRLAPGRVPRVVRSYRPWYVRTLAALLIGPVVAFAVVYGVVLGVVGVFEFDLVMLGVGLGAAWLGVAGLRWVGKVIAPVRAEMPSLVTFRDLSYRLVGQEPRRSVRSS